MRLWSIHPKYLDTKGLGALWRESLLAQAVLLKKTKGWKNHPQLDRFKEHPAPISAIGYYLLKIHEEATCRGYKYDKTKVNRPDEVVDQIEITDGQLNYEMKILIERLKNRAPSKYSELLSLQATWSYPDANPIFIVINGCVALWEKAYWRKLEKAPSDMRVRGNG
jgi:hypothetical protein